jgi:hypothetical protein
MAEHIPTIIVRFMNFLQEGKMDVYEYCPRPTQVIVVSCMYRLLGIFIRKLSCSHVLTLTEWRLLGCYAV